MARKNFAKLTGDLEVLFFRQLFRSFGVHSNIELFDQLAHCVPRTIILRHRHNIMDLEAILFGQAGLIPGIPVDGYSAELLYRYTNFRYKYNLVSMNAELWKFGYEHEFPTIRIAQLAALIHQQEDLYAKCTNLDTGLNELRSLLNVHPSYYWDEHFRFGIWAERRTKEISEKVIDAVLNETIRPIRELFKAQHES